MSVQCRMKNSGHSSTNVNTPTRPKNSLMSTRSSLPIFFFMTVTYTPYITALIKAMLSPIAICEIVLCGNDPLFSSLSPDRSTVEMRIIPASDARTPASLRTLKVSTPDRAPRMSVHMLLVEVRIVTLETLVYSRQAAAK